MSAIIRANVPRVILVGEQKAGKSTHTFPPIP